VVPSGMPHTGPDIPITDMQLIAASNEVTGSELLEPLSKDLCGPLG